MKIAVICGVVLIAFGTLVFTYFLPWAPLNPNWTIKRGEKIERIEFGIFTSPDPEIASALVYLVTDDGRRKLYSTDTLSVNGQKLKPTYYNNGVAVGYKYQSAISSAGSYVLSLKRDGQEEIQKTIQKDQLGKTMTFEL